jgi:hypothetical protein
MDLKQIREVVVHLYLEEMVRKLKITSALVSSAPYFKLKYLPLEKHAEGW